LLRQWGGESVWRETLVFLFELLSAERGADWVDDLVEVLFGLNVGFDYKRATLGARLLADQHVRLGQAWEELLADFCSDWRRVPWVLEDEVLPLLVDAGYAVIVHESLEAVQHETRLRVLFTHDNAVVDVSPLAGLSALRVLNIDGTGVTDVSPLAGLSALRVLGLSGTGVTDVSPLAGLSALRVLDLSGTGVTDVSPLARLSALQELHLIGTGVTDLSPLAGLSALEWLDLSGTGVTDVSSLAGLSALHRLVLRDMDGTDLKPLVGLPNLEVFIGGKWIRPAELHSDDFARIDADHSPATIALKS